MLFRLTQPVQKFIIIFDCYIENYSTLNCFMIIQPQFYIFPSKNYKFLISDAQNANSGQYNKIMSVYNPLMHKTNSVSSSTVFFPKSLTPSPQNYQNPPSTIKFAQNTIQNHSSEIQTQKPPRNMATQSVIFASRGEPRPTLGGLGKLDTMARHVNLTQSQELLSQKRNSADKAPFSRTAFSGREGNPFTSQILTPKPPSRSSWGEEEKSRRSDFVQGQKKQRRQSFDMEEIARLRGVEGQRFKFLQRSQPFQPIPANQTKTQQKKDCQSTSSGSGTQLFKPKQFDFLKKKKEVKEQLMTNTWSGSNQAVKTFNPLKKSDIMWPLAISPIQQKFPKTYNQENGHSQQTSTSAVENHPRPSQIARNGNIEFKKKKLQERPLSPNSISPGPSVKLQTSNRLKTAKTYNDFDREQLSGPTFRTRVSMKPPRQITIDDFEVISKLGKGAFGQVFMAMEKVLGLICVIKKMSKKRIKQAQVEQHIIRQIKLQSYLNHAHLTSLYGFFHDEQYLYLVLECLPDGSLQQMKKKKKLPQKQSIQIVKQVALGLKYMHSQFVIHRDLKPQNLFVNEGYVKIGDFGCSIYHNQVGLRNTIVGCLEYSSPEQLSREGYTDKIDAWSIGIMTYQLMFGKSPFQNDIKKMLIAGQGNTELPEVTFPTAPTVSQEAKNFILNLLDRQPQKRMDMDEVLHHPFLRDCQS